MSGLKRSSTWNPYTAMMTLHHLGGLFGALAALDDGGPVMKVPLSSLTLGLLAFPSIWRWYLGWVFARRDGKFTSAEIGFLSKGISLLKKDSGWVPQQARLAERLVAIAGLISDKEIDAAKADWANTCSRCLDELVAMRADIMRNARPERRPFELLRPVLDAANPLNEYLKIADEIRGRIPDEARHPRAAAIAVKEFLIFRLSIALGFRSKNMRELLIAMQGKSKTDIQLEKLQRGELRWDSKHQVWKVFAPSIAFKNNNSSYFKQSPFEMEIPDRGHLYELLDAYLTRHRPRLLAGNDDPGTVFVRVRRSGQKGNAEYTSGAFQSRWRSIIQNYGIFNPYTGKGAIEGLLPHGPHGLRHVLATHVLKRTGSVEYASYAIQNAPWTVYEYYGRFLPRDKARIAGAILDEVWEGMVGPEALLVPTAETFYAPRAKFIK